jgi:hypothetical protein
VLKVPNRVSKCGAAGELRSAFALRPNPLAKNRWWPSRELVLPADTSADRTQAS